MQRLGLKPTGWIIIYALILLAWITPFGVLTALFLMIPSLMLYMHLQEKPFAVVIIVFHLLLFLIAGRFGFSLLLLSLFFMIPAIVMGLGYKRHLSAFRVIAYGALAIIIELTIIIVIVSAFGPNVMEWVKEFIRESVSTIPQPLMQGWDTEFMEFVITMMVRMLPVYMVFFALTYAFVTHSLSRQLIKLSNMTLPGLPPLKQWMLPKSFVWYYLLALLANLFLDPASGTFLVTILWNVIPILTFAFIVQAISFLFYLADVKGWNPALPIVGIVIAFLFPSIVSLLGVFDIAFKLRDYLKET